MLKLKYKKFIRKIKRDAPKWMVFLPTIFAIFILIEIMYLLNLETPTYATNKIESPVLTNPTKINEKDQVYIKYEEEVKVPIIMFHYIRDADSPMSKIGKNLSVSPKNFENILKKISEKKYHSVTMNEFSQNKLEYKNIALTFDDGYLDFYTNAFPLLKKYQIKATVYVIKNKINQDGYLTQSMIDELTESNLVEIGSHTLNHIKLTQVDSTKEKNEIFESRGSSVSFCYPMGDFNENSINLVKEAGYLNATTTKNGIATNKSDKFQLPRIRATNDTNIERYLE